MGEYRVFEYGTDVALQNAVRSLVSGIAALKVSVDVLNKRIEVLEADLQKLSNRTEELSERMGDYLSAMRSVADRLDVRAEEFLERLHREVELTVDVVVKKVVKQVEEMGRRTDALVADFEAMRSEVGDNTRLSFDTLLELKHRVEGMENQMEELRLGFKELELAVKALEESLLHKIRDLELLVTDLSIRLGRFEKNVLKEDVSSE